MEGEGSVFPEEDTSHNEDVASQEKREEESREAEGGSNDQEDFVGFEGDDGPGGEERMQEATSDVRPGDSTVDLPTKLYTTNQLRSLEQRLWEGIQVVRDAVESIQSQRHNLPVMPKPETTTSHRPAYYCEAHGPNKSHNTEACRGFSWRKHLASAAKAAPTKSSRASAAPEAKRTSEATERKVKLPLCPKCGYRTSHTQDECFAKLCACHACGQTGHLQLVCPSKKKAKKGEAKPAAKKAEAKPAAKKAEAKPAGAKKEDKPAAEKKAATPKTEAKKAAVKKAEPKPKAEPKKSTAEKVEAKKAEKKKGQAPSKNGPPVDQTAKS